jgi:cyclophilin family peptidyl-prolyl cis-trans isomerase
MLSAASTEVDDAVLVEICFTLGQWRAAEAKSFLQRMLTDDQPQVRAAALLALGKMDDDSSTDLAVDALRDPAPEVRQAAALALFRMDGRRYDHPRLADEALLSARDAALAGAALKDPDAGVRWRATYALANIRSRPGLATILGRCVRDPSSALSRVFAMRGLGALEADDPVGALAEARRGLADDDPRVVLEAARLVTAHGTWNEILELTRAPSTNVCMLAIDQLRLQTLAKPASEAWITPLLNACDELLERNSSEALRREVRALLVAVAAHEELRLEAPLDVNWTGAISSQEPPARLQAAGHDARRALMHSGEPRDRERLARLLSDDELQDRALLDQLLEDPIPSVVAAALGTLDSRNVAALYHDRERLESALAHADPAIRGTAAQLIGPLVRDGEAPPWLVNAVADSLDQIASMSASESLEMEEARESLAQALDLPSFGPMPPSDVPEGSLLERLLAEQDRAQRDAAPEVLLETDRGEIRLVLDRLAAPRHVESFLELAQDGFYDGLDVHRVVPNFVVQGLDPRRDGWGVGGRRVPDEFGPEAYLTGSLGMPHAGSPQSGGCQIFISLVPTPHLEGAYTQFGRVLKGMDVVAALEIGDEIKRVRRVSGLAPNRSHKTQ